VVTAHIVLAAWREAARAARVPTPLGERTLGAWVQAREAALIRRARRVIAPSAKVQAEIARCYGRTAGVSVVHHGFSVAAAERRSSHRDAARQALGLPAEATIALFVGDLRKGYAAAAEAVAQNPEVHLAVVSRSRRPPDGEIEVQRLLGARLHWLGALEDVGPAYAAADLLLHPTIYDAFGLVVAEAMAHGVPPVVTAAAGIAELIRHRESGWIVEGDARAGTAAAVSALARDRALRERLGAGAQAVATSRSWDRVAQETLAIYEEAARAR
jgi:UDP-glucose:(heptosyl)LPS alpha-1,3-glucosyltransferase